MSNPDLFSPVILGDLTLKNRIFMAPMTRTRVDENDVILPVAAGYYGQRAAAGLIISEATYIAPGGKVRASQPGIFTKVQIAAWKKVTDAVHEKGSVIFAQLSHSGRSAIPKFNGGLHPVAPSALSFNSGAHGSVVGKESEPLIPNALMLAEISQLIHAYGKAAENALLAGFDGVELHAGNAGLVEQFLDEVSNIRKDEYGGTLENRARFLLEAVDALIGVFGKGRVGLRLSPHDRMSDQYDPDPVATTSFIAREMNSRGIAYINLLEPHNKSDAFIPYPPNDPETIGHVRALFKGILVANGGYTLESGNHAVQNGQADAIAYGRSFLSNPDLPHRFQYGLTLNQPDFSTFYGRTETGYLDYPFAF